jgi:hypothetical protein
METKTIELKSGIVIKDSRSLGCGIMIENQNTKYMTLGYSSQNGFYLNMKGVSITMNDYPEYYKEFDIMRLSLAEANQILAQ